MPNNMADLMMMMNEEIRDREVRVIDQNGEQLGVQPIRKAILNPPKKLEAIW